MERQGMTLVDARQHLRSTLILQGALNINLQSLPFQTSQAGAMATPGNANSKYFWLCVQRMLLLVTALEGSCRCSGQMPSPARSTRSSQRHSGQLVRHYHLTTLLSLRTITLLHHGYHQTDIVCVQNKLTFSRPNLGFHSSHTVIWTKMEAQCPKPGFYFINNKTEARKIISSIIRELNVLDDINLILMTKSYLSGCMKSFLKQFPYLPT